MLALRPGRRTRARSGAAVAGGAGRGAALALGPAGLLVACLLAAGCGGGSAAAGPAASPSTADRDAGVFITRILREEINGQWDVQWGDLHPGHQRLITRAEYVACSRAMGTAIGNGKEVFRVLDVRDEAIHVRGVPQTTSKLVTVMFHRAGKAAGLTYRLHAVSVGGRWTWILGERFLAAVAHGQCLDGSPLRPSA